MPGGLLGQLGQLFQRRYGKPPAVPQAPQAPKKQETVADKGSDWPTTSQLPEFNDPIVAQLNNQLTQEQPKPVPTEAELLKQEQHDAWARYDFERCIVIFSRLHELEPDNPDWVDKLKVSYFNRGKQYETDGNEERAIACYYSALKLDPSFPEAKEAAQSLLDNAKSEKAESKSA
jgi:tetratricopeptide (TPR) repeat protein